jgi:AcrR family transcriptional regulator
MSVSEGSTRSAKGARTRRAVLDAAAARFGREGYRATSVADIARDAGVGGTVAYAYFPNKEALFLAAVDEDAAAVIQASLAGLIDTPSVPEWPVKALLAAMESLEHHPLARRLLAGLEPEFMNRVTDVPAILEMRKLLAERLRADQATGWVRDDIDPTSAANGIVSIMLSLLVSLVQLGPELDLQYAADVNGVLHASVAGLHPPAGRQG